MDEGVSAVSWRHRARPWLVAVLTIALAVVLTAVVGGFRTAPPDLGPELPVDQAVELRRWDVEFRTCEYTDRAADADYQIDPVVRMELVLTWKGDETELDPGGVIDVQVDGVGQEVPYTQPVDGRAGEYDPDIPRAVQWEFKADAPPSRVALVLRDEVQADSFVYNEAWAAERLVGHLGVDCPDRRPG